MLKQCGVHLLPSETGILSLNTIHDHLADAANSAEIPTQPRQDLYVTSNDEIKIGDWFYGTLTNVVGQATKNDVENIFPYQNSDKPFPYFKDRYFKIIATTNPNIQWNDFTRTMAALPTDFIQAYIRNYNNRTPIKEILVEYKEDFIQDNTDPTKQVKIYVPNLRMDGTIIPHPVKPKMYTEEEVIEICNTYVEAQTFAKINAWPRQSFVEWFRIHYK